MKIGAYQFAVTGDIQSNLNKIQKAIIEASGNGVRLLVFPECALTGYPPLKIASPKDIDFALVENSLDKLRDLSREYGIYLFIGSVFRENDMYYNSVVAISPVEDALPPYHKRALWGWDVDNFIPGDNKGIYEIDGLRIGIRVCFEVRFPEYFRELFKERTVFNIVSFCDVSDKDDVERYGIIKAHLITRAAENACTILSVNDIAPYQTAPTAVINEDGQVLEELPRNSEQMLIFNYDEHPLSFSAKGRKTVTERMVIAH